MLIIGLDGATWDLLDPWIRAGRLPHLGRLRDRSVWGELRSTMPPVTFPAWTTFATGVNPGKHGIFDFTRREAGSYGVRFVNATFRKAPSIWRRLSDAGRRVCIVGIPGTYPPEQVNGCMISGFDTPVTTRADRSFVHPPEWAAGLLGDRGFPFADFQEFRVGRAWYREALASLLRGIETKTRLGLELLRRERWDCFLLLFGESDTVAHHFWHLHDHASPRFDPALAAEVGDAIAQVYEALDNAVGRLLAAAADDTVMVASDHGFGGVGTKTLYLNRWLEAAGFQGRTERAAGPGLAGRLKRLALEHTPAVLQARLFRLADGRIASRLESAARFAGIDWSRTTVFSEDLNYFPSLWLNVRGREPRGTVAAADYEKVRTEVMAAIAEWRDPTTGEAIVRRAWRREEIHEGPYVDLAPDIVLELALDGGYSYACAPSAAAAPGQTIRVGLAGGGGKLDGMSGSHRREGVYALAAPGLAPQAWRGADIADMGATILACLGVDVPAGLDGRPVGSTWIEGESGSGEPPRPESAYSAEEEREIEARLGALGYF
jgi:predicted AlkP superfamily phosphohydrolase/phosphomutase